MVVELIVYDVDLSFVFVFDMGFVCKVIGNCVFGEDV